MYAAISLPADYSNNGYIGAREGSEVKNILLVKRTRVQSPALTSDSSQLPITPVKEIKVLYEYLYITHIDTYIYITKTKITLKNDRYVCYKQLKSRSWQQGRVYRICMYIESFLLLLSESLSNYGNH